MFSLKKNLKKFHMKKISVAPYGQKKMSSNLGLLNSKWPARPHGFNEANDKLIRVRGAEISYRNPFKATAEIFIAAKAALKVVVPEVRESADKKVAAAGFVDNEHS
jgi:hypothetical protein